MNIQINQRWTDALGLFIICASLITGGCPRVDTGDDGDASSGDGGANPDADPDSSSGDGALDGDADDGHDDGGPDADRRVDADVDIGPDLSQVLIYAHSSDTLFTFSPYTLTVEEVGIFTLDGGDEAPNMLDLAVNADGEVFTCSADTLFRVDPETAATTLVGSFDLDGERLYALSFLAPGEYGDHGETLVGATNEGVYYVIDESTAHAQYLGTYPDGWLSSGDIVSVSGLGTFATVRRDDFPADVLVQILFAADGSSTAVQIGVIRSDDQDFTQLFGLGYWGHALFGFSNAGELIEINRETGHGDLVTAETGTDQFWGAGVTTQVPVVY